MADLIVRVSSPDYSTWLNAFVSAEPGLVEAGINQWTVYQDTWNPNVVMVHFIADDLDRAMAFFRSEEFKEINARSGATDRTFFIAQQPGAAAPAAKKTAAKASTAKTAGKSTTTAKTAAKPAETAEKAPAKPRATRSTPKK
jgi:uncharacterized protein (DUF1330 family)